MRQEKKHFKSSPSRHGKRATILFLIVSILLSIPLSLFLVSQFHSTRVLEASTPPALLGNKPETIALLEKEKDDVRPFTFWVAGDDHKDNYLRILYPDQVKPQHPSFGIVLGDIVVNPVKEQHHYFWHEWRQWGMDSPVLLVLGNHDVVEADPTGVPDSAPNAFDLRQFDDAYGPTDVSFKYAGCLFVILNDVLQSDAYIGFLQKVLEKEASSARMIFVLCHIPPRTAHTVTTYPAVARPGFTDLVEKYHVDYVISGHFHTYLRKTLAGTTYLITGGGTGLSGRESQFLSHGIFFDVDPASRTVSERVMVIHDGIPEKILFHLNFFTTLRLAPFVTYHPFPAWCGFVVNLLVLVFFLTLLAGRLKKRRDG